MFNGDWTEQSPLEKQNGLSFWRFIWTRFQSKSVFSDKREYYFGFSQKKRQKPTVLSGSMFQDQVVCATRRKLLGSISKKMHKGLFMERHKALKCILFP
jgi:hypothetical protein